MVGAWNVMADARNPTIKTVKESETKKNISPKIGRKINGRKNK